MIRLRGLKNHFLMGAFIGFVGVAIYPVIISPMINSDYYKKIRAETNKSFKQEDNQPGSMKVWSDPYGKK